MKCSTKKCFNQTRPSPGALYCQGCQEQHLERIKPHPVPPPSPGYKDPWRDGPPNATCPACSGRYHYGAPVPFIHSCPLCRVWLCWKETDALREKKRRVARKCPVCKKILQKKPGKYGPWWGCTWVRKGHKENCSGRRQWNDCDIEIEMVPRLVLATWRPHVWDDSNDVDHFARLDQATQERKTAREERGKRYKPRWWERRETFDKEGELV